MTAATAKAGSSLCIGITIDRRIERVIAGYANTGSLRTRRATSSFVVSKTNSTVPSNETPR